MPEYTVEDLLFPQSDDAVALVWDDLLAKPIRWQSEFRRGLSLRNGVEFDSSGSQLLQGAPAPGVLVPHGGRGDLRSIRCGNGDWLSSVRGQGSDRLRPDPELDEFTTTEAPPTETVDVPGDGTVSVVSLAGGVVVVGDVGVAAVTPTATLDPLADDGTVADAVTDPAGGVRLGALCDDPASAGIESVDGVLTSEFSGDAAATPAAGVEVAAAVTVSVAATTG
jgi:hypothetical protein